MIIVSGMGKGKEKVFFKEGMTVEGAIQAAKLNPNENATITLNGQEATKDAKIKDGDRIVVTPKVKNG